MTRQPPVGALSHHAQDRVFQRSRLTPLEVQLMFDAHQFFWAIRPRQGCTSFALIFDALAQDYLVAVVECSSRVVKTVLTLTQFEESYRPVSAAAKLLARMALLSSEDQKQLAPRKVEVTNVDADMWLKPVRPSWRFVVEDEAGASHVLGTLSYREICEIFYCKPVSTGAELRRRARYVVKTKRFLSWFVQALADVSVSGERVRVLKVEALNPENAEYLFEADMTREFGRALKDPHPERFDALARTVSREAREEARRAGVYVSLRHRVQLEYASLQVA
jgi:hypothetical protein